jgi:serine/threonine protein kinase
MASSVTSQFVRATSPRGWLAGRWKPARRSGSRRSCSPGSPHPPARIVHRDIKPANIFLTKSALGDFRIATRTKGSGLHHPGELMGTVRYMAPEQATDALPHPGRMSARGLCRGRVGSPWLATRTRPVQLAQAAPFAGIRRSARAGLDPARREAQEFRRQSRSGRRLRRRRRNGADPGDLFALRCPPPSATDPALSLAIRL